jgi:hypothetical protein
MTKEDVKRATIMPARQQKRVARLAAFKEQLISEAPDLYVCIAADLDCCPRATQLFITSRNEINAEEMALIQKLWPHGPVKHFQAVR